LSEPPRVNSPEVGLRLVHEAALRTVITTIDAIYVLRSKQKIQEDTSPDETFYVKDSLGKIVLDTQADIFVKDTENSATREDFDNALKTWNSE